MATEAAKDLSRVFAEIPFGLPEEPLPSKEALGFRVPLSAPPLHALTAWTALSTTRRWDGGHVMIA